MPQTPRLEVGEKAPAFSLLDADGKTVKLSDYKGRKVIVYFYPAASTPGCTKEACDFRDNLGELHRRRVRRSSESRPTSRPSWPSSAMNRTSRSLCSRRPGPRGPRRRCVFGEKTMYWKTVQGELLDLRGRREGQNRSGRSTTSGLHVRQL